MIIISNTANGRINLMGRHIDHQGGYYNMTIINKCVICNLYVMSEKSPTITFISSQYEPYSYNIDDLSTDNIANNWTKYTIAPLIYLLNKYPKKSKKLLNKMTMIVDSNIPQGCGLSSSSALIIASMKCYLQLLEIEIDDKVLVEYSGESEKLIGTNGGYGDHASIIFGRYNTIIKALTTPKLVIEDKCEKPNDLLVYIYNSGVVAKKGFSGCNKIFNSRIKCYNKGFARLSSCEYLKDVTEKDLEELDDNPNVYDVMKYGYNEYNRSCDFINACKNNNYEKIGQIVKESMLDEQQLYKCSCKEIDEMVSKANKIDGVLGAQICGAGMGGCVTIFALKKALVKPVFSQYELVDVC